MAYLAETECCGIRELDGVEEQSAERSALDAAYYWFEHDKDGAHIFFSVTNRKLHGKNLAAYIIKNKLGTVIKTSPTKNPNSGNMLTMWVWTVNKATFRAFWDKHRRGCQSDDEDDDEDYW